MRLATRALAEYEPRACAGLPAVLLRSSASSQMALSSHLDADTRDYFAGCAGAEALEGDATTRAWRELLGEGMTTVGIPGDHFATFDEENVSSTLASYS